MRLLLVLAGLAFTACSQTVGPDAGRSDDAQDYEPGVLIPEDQFAITSFECEERTSEMFIDEELTAGRQFWGRGVIENTSGERSPNWLIAWTASLDDGTELGGIEEDGLPARTLVLPLSAGESAEFAFLIASDRTIDSDRTVTSCDFTVEDSPLNYAFDN